MVVLGIDLSIRGTGLCLLDGESVEPPVLETLSLEDFSERECVMKIVSRVLAIVLERGPNLVAIEDYAMGSADTNNITRLAEIGGVIKWELQKAGFAFGYGTARNKADRDVARATTLTAQRLLVLQPSSTMKSFCLGKGNVPKDTRYLLTVKEQMGIHFTDDNQADAYMHAYMAGLVVAVLRGQIPIGNLPEKSQHALIERARKKTKGISEKKAMKLSDEEKFKLIQFI